MTHRNSVIYAGGGGYLPRENNMRINDSQGSVIYEGGRGHLSQEEKTCIEVNFKEFRDMRRLRRRACTIIK